MILVFVNFFKHADAFSCPFIILSSFLSSQKKVLFVHRGVSFGRFVLFVSDGKHYVSALLEVIITLSHFFYSFIYFLW